MKQTWILGSAVIGYSLEVVAFEVWVSVLLYWKKCTRHSGLSFSSEEGSQQAACLREDILSLTAWVEHSGSFCFMHPAPT